MFLLSLLIGVVAGVGAILFNLTQDAASDLMLKQAAGFSPPQPHGEITAEGLFPPRGPGHGYEYVQQAIDGALSRREVIAAYHDRIEQAKKV